MREDFITGKKKVQNDCSEIYLVFSFSGIQRQLVPMEQKGKIRKSLHLSCGTEREKGQGRNISRNSVEFYFAIDPLKFFLAHSSMCSYPVGMN